MSVRLQVVLSLLLIVVFFMILNQIRRRKLSLQYTLSWLSVLLLLLIVIIFPSLLSKFSYLVGVYAPTNMIFFLGFLFTLRLVYRLTSAISKQSEKICSLSQKIALLEKKGKEREVEK